MISKLGSRSRIGLGALVVSACVLPALAAGYHPASDPGTMQTMADLTLIDRQCQDVAVDFGRLFRFGEAHGIHNTDIMPLGSKRAIFDAAMKHRLQISSPAVLCSTIANQVDVTAPGILAPR